MKRSYFFIILILLCFAANDSFAQGEADSLYISPADSSKKIEIGNIYVSGNKRTKGYIIIREIHFQQGDSLVSGKFNAELLRAQYQVYNTTLFTEVAIRPAA